MSAAEPTKPVWQTSTSHEIWRHEDNNRRLLAGQHLVSVAVAANATVEPVALICLFSNSNLEVFSLQQTSFFISSFKQQTKLNSTFYIQSFCNSGTPFDTTWFSNKTFTPPTCETRICLGSSRANNSDSSSNNNTLLVCGWRPNAIYYLSFYG